MSIPITVLMPAFNAEKYIQEAIDSILNQSFTNFELLIINDCSTDQTLKIIKNYNDPRIKVYTNPKNIGLTNSLNKGISLAKGEYIARLDADDVAFPRRLQLQLNEFQKDSNLGLVASWTIIINESGKTIGRGNWNFTPEDIYYILHFRNCLTHSSIMFKKNLIKSLGGYDNQAFKMEDFDLWRRLTKVAKAKQIEKYLVKWRVTDSGVTGTGREEMANNARKLCAFQLKSLTNKIIEPQIIDALINKQKVISLNVIQAKNLALIFPEIASHILANTPSFYNLQGIEKYIEVEFERYNIYLKKFHIQINVPLPFRLTFKEFFYARLIEAAKLPGLSRLYYFMPYSHF